MPNQTAMREKALLRDILADAEEHLDRTEARYRLAIEHTQRIYQGTDPIQYQFAVSWERLAKESYAAATRERDRAHKALRNFH